ncbi:hypothetical protein [Saccharothrix longispora]|uniref:hypothetical protein n=1 Tax=Saccharothrix longispora TaxID=33920 RepID=UPI0028FD8E35|nr:hypothetical protein [Saccharothrix longispora]MBY8848874.1 hypothetical protein [Saccharothrix sp. MB29]MDU0290332.1 hypothetical protein [Saccharothrix longispora]
MEKSTERTGAALRHVVDLALRGMRSRGVRTPHPVRPAQWVMTADGVIDGPRDEEPTAGR